MVFVQAIATQEISAMLSANPKMYMTAVTAIWVDAEHERHIFSGSCIERCSTLNSARYWPKVCVTGISVHHE